MGRAWQATCDQTGAIANTASGLARKVVFTIIFSAISAYLCDLCVKYFSYYSYAEITEIHKDRREDFKSYKGYFSCKAGFSLG